MTEQDIEKFIHAAILRCEWRYRAEVIKYAIIEKKPDFFRAAFEIEGKSSMPIYTIVKSGEHRETGLLLYSEVGNHDWITCTHSPAPSSSHRFYTSHG